MALARALYRAALRGANAVEQAEGGLMQIVGPVNSAEWGAYRRLTAQDRDEQREALFPWASADDTVSEPGALTGGELRARPFPHQGFDRINIDWCEVAARAGGGRVRHAPLPRPVNYTNPHRI